MMIKLKDLLSEISYKWRSAGREPEELIDAIHKIVQAVDRDGKIPENWISVSKNGSKWGIFRPHGYLQVDDSNFALVFDERDKSWSIMWLPGKKMQKINKFYLEAILTGWINGF